MSRSCHDGRVREDEPTNQSERTTNFLSLWIGGYGNVLSGACSLAMVSLSNWEERATLESSGRSCGSVRGSGGL